MNKQIPLYWLFIIMAIGLMAYIAKPDASRELLRQQRDVLTQKLQKEKSRYDSLSLKTESDSLKYIDAITKEKKVLRQLAAKIDSLKKIRYDDNKARRDYFDSDFNERLGTLATNVGADDMER